MNQFQQQFKIYSLTSCVLAAILLWAAGCSASDHNPKDNTHDPESVWNEMKSRLTNGDIQGALAFFSVTSQDKYQQAFHSMSKTELESFLKSLGPIKKSAITNDKAQYYFDNIIDGKAITFPIEFDKENGEWKIVEF